MFEGGLMVRGLAAVPAGPELAAALAGVDRAGLNGYELVELAKAQYRQVAHCQGELLATVWETAYCPPGDYDSPPQRVDGPDDYAADEIRWALTLTRRAADNLFGTAYSLVERLPALCSALRAGSIDLPKANVIDTETCALPEGLARRVVEQILPLAPELTTGQLRARLRKLVITVDPDAAARRQREAVKRRFVHHGPDLDGTATLAGHQLAPDKAATAAARIDGLAKTLKRAGDARSLDELRADVFLNILNGDPLPENGNSVGGVELVVPLTTLMGLSEQPGDLEGWGPVIAEMARSLADAQRGGRWLVSVYDDDGNLVHHGRLRRRPTVEQAGFVKTRDRTCRAPGCRTPAHRSDLDHTTAWEVGGGTVPQNLGVLCRHDHGYKHHDGVRLEQPEPGVFVWTTRLGHTYTTRPQPP